MLLTAEDKPIANKLASVPSKVFMFLMEAVSSPGNADHTIKPSPLVLSREPLAPGLAKLWTALLL
jgi:hypothetical protein